MLSSVESSDGEVSVERQYYSVECTGLENRLVDCSWTIRTIESRKRDVLVICTNGEWQLWFVCVLTLVCMCGCV